MKVIKAALAAFLSGEGFAAMVVVLLLAFLLSGCSSSPKVVAELEPTTVDQRQPIERLAVCEEIFRDGAEAKDCYVVLSLVDKAEEGRL